MFDGAAPTAESHSSCCCSNGPDSYASLVYQLSYSVGHTDGLTRSVPRCGTLTRRCSVTLLSVSTTRLQRCTVRCADCLQRLSVVFSDIQLRRRRRVHRSSRSLSMFLSLSLSLSLFHLLYRLSAPPCALKWALVEMTAHHDLRHGHVGSRLHSALGDAFRGKGLYHFTDFRRHVRHCTEDNLLLGALTALRGDVLDHLPARSSVALHCRRRHLNVDVRVTTARVRTSSSPPISSVALSLLIQLRGYSVLSSGCPQRLMNYANTSLPKLFIHHLDASPLHSSVISRSPETRPFTLRWNLSFIASSVQSKLQVRSSVSLIWFSTSVEQVLEYTLHAHSTHKNWVTSSHHLLCATSHYHLLLLLDSVTPPRLFHLSLFGYL